LRAASIEGGSTPVDTGAIAKTAAGQAHLLILDPAILTTGDVTAFSQVIEAAGDMSLAAERLGA
jgi:hypothetical protein